MSFDLRGDGRVALITGAASGIGRAVAERFGAAGYRLALLDVDRDNGEAVARKLRDDARDARFFAADVADAAAVDAAFDAALSGWQQLDFVLHAAAILGPAALVENTETADVDRLLDVDLRGAFHVCRAAVRTLKKLGGGSILNVASITAETGSAYYPAYSAAKAGLIALTRSVARNCGRFNVRINCLSPGSIVGTNFADRARAAPPSPEKRLRESAALMKKIPIGRPGRPDDVANFALFLASPLARHVHGAVLTIDGGENLGFH
ncbi:MAG: SDR family oxidoreductase [bacterium]|nr:SDR family oxidoreductase [bacterium]